ncbi:hypothetical protein [Tenacibaculum sp. A30]|uniref:hypothetical protein n=1 Tax=Tenacibaculum sp. A30 TaxID=3442644 RepID=UPI003EB97684
MRKLNKITQKSTLFPIIGLIFLLLFSPCKVRNFVQAELNVPQTEVSNKSQTTHNQLSCYDSEITDASLIQVASSTKILAVFLTRAFNFSFYFIESFPSKITADYQKKRFVTSSIPLYILFKNFKVYL